MTATERTEALYLEYLARGWNSGSVALAIEAAESSALERAAQAFAEAPTTQHSGAAVASILRYLTRESVPRPAAAPAAVPDNLDRCSQIATHYQRCTLLRDHRGDHAYPAPPSEPVAPAPDLRIQRNRFEKCAQLFAEIRGDWTDPRDACREGRKLCMDALADIDAALTARAAPHAKGEGKT